MAADSRSTLEDYQAQLTQDATSATRHGMSRTALENLPDANLDDPEATPESKNPSGVSKTQQLLTEFLDKPFDEQKKDVDQKWLELAYALPTRALRLALTATKKEMGQVQQIVTAAAIAKDKRFPNDDGSITVKIPARMLGSYSAALILRPTEKATSLTDATPAS